MVPLFGHRTPHGLALLGFTNKSHNVVVVGENLLTDTKCLKQNVDATYYTYEICFCEFLRYHCGLDCCDESNPQ